MGGINNLISAITKSTTPQTTTTIKLTLSNENLSHIHQDITAFYNHPLDGQTFSDILRLAHLNSKHGLSQAGMDHEMKMEGAKRSQPHRASVVKAVPAGLSRSPGSDVPHARAECEPRSRAVL